MKDAILLNSYDSTTLARKKKNFEDEIAAKSLRANTILALQVA